MRSPFTTPQGQNQLPHPKPTNTLFQNTNNHTAQFLYEPTSVLDLRRSPSPVLGNNNSDSVNNFTAISGISDDTSLPWDDHVALPQPPHHLHPQNFLSEDWDSMMLNLSEKDDSTPLHFNPPPPLPPPFLLNENFNNFSTETFQNLELEFDCSQLDQLIRAATFVESNDLHSAQVILSRLNQHLHCPFGKPLQRACFYFKEALQFFLTHESRDNNYHHHHLSPLQVVQKIKSYKSFSEISPITMFASFTANQALLEALDGTLYIHVVDFEIGIGGQWASFMQEIANKAKSRNVLASSLRITAVVPEESSMEAGLIRENLQQFAQEVGIQFQLEFIMFNSFDDLMFNSIRFVNGESIAVNLSPAIFRCLKTSESIAGFLRFLRRISPRITVFIDGEGCRESRGTSFRKNFINGLEFYSTLFEALDAANNGDVELVRRIERFLLKPKIFANVSSAGNCILPWRELFSSVGMIPVQFSEFTDSQAEWLVRRAQVRGFHVEKRHGSMLLCWHERELVSTSAWRC
ncbi:hypothetical protein IFM89_032452 [Coptis chinensis]|uniref:Uncharacterized protein n=1 Tax=Coptis chinensis TaxID=261450 RepID=A0A835M062_9MAGN|nr:hypothetical protein IFM89_032452 [Coptis chinensis]